MAEKQFKFLEMKNVDQKVVQVIMYEDKEQAGTLILTPEGWEEFQEQVRRTKVRCEG